MGKSKKPSRKDDVIKARALLKQFKEHQEKVNNNPDHLAVAHWKREKVNFKSRIDFYVERAKVSIDDVDRAEHSSPA